MLKVLTRGCLPILLFVATAHGQAPQPKGPAFDVAAISVAEPLDIAKIAASAQSGNMANLRLPGMNITETRVDITLLSLTQLVQIAFKVQAYQLTAPAWLNDARFDIHATIPPGATREQVPDMLQALLVERFGMVIHRESKEMPVYSLIVGKDGPKMPDAAPLPTTPLGEPGPDDIAIGQGENQVRIARGTGPNSAGSATVSTGRMTMNIKMGEDGKMQMDISRMTMEELTQALVQFVERPVVDNTGLKGAYQVKLELNMADMLRIAQSSGLLAGLGGAGGGGGAPVGLPASGAADPSGNSIFEAVQSLGLKLEPKRAPIDIVVIDKMEKSPTAN